MSDLLQLVEPMIPALRRYARALLRDRAGADDLVQDCLERVIAHWHLRRDKDPRTWVFAILHNLAVDKFRQSVRRGEHVPYEEINEGALTQRSTQEDGLMSADVLSCVALLHEEQRSVLLLVSVEGLSYAEIAEVLDIPLGTVMSRLSRARERLRQILQDPSRSAKPGSHLRRVK